MDKQIASLDEFLSHCRKSLSYLEEFGFSEVSPPSHRGGNPFEVWFKAGKRNVIIIGEGWGTSVSMYLEHDDGFELAVIYLVPKDKRPQYQKKSKNNPTQLEQVSRSANWLKEYGRDFLEGDLEKFFRYARPLPPYKLPQ